MCKVLKDSSENSCKPGVVPCCCLGNSTDSFKMGSNEMGSIHERTCYTDIDTRKKVSVLPELVYNLYNYN